jgi:hypothetical protein
MEQQLKLFSKGQLGENRNYKEVITIDTTTPGVATEVLGSSREESSATEGL